MDLHCGPAPATCATCWMLIARIPTIGYFLKGDKNLAEVPDR